MSTLKLLLLVLGFSTAAPAQTMGDELSRVQIRFGFVAASLDSSEREFNLFRKSDEFQKFARFEYGNHGSKFGFENARMSLNEAQQYIECAANFIEKPDSVYRAELCVQRADNLLDVVIRGAKAPFEFVSELRASMSNGKAMLNTMSAELDTIASKIAWFQRTLLVGADSALYKHGRHGVGREAQLLGMQRQAETYHRLADSAFTSGNYGDFLKRRKEFDAVYAKFTGQSIFYNRNFFKEHK